MTWLYLPSSVLPVVEEDSTSALSSLSEALELSATWRTKSRPARTWSKAFAPGSYLTRLFGPISSPSTRARGVALWTESLAVTRASHSVSQGSASAPTIRATSGHTSPTSFGQLSLDGASSRTSAVICDWDSAKSPRTFEQWATALRRHCGERRKSAPRTAESASSSSLWTTPTKGDGDGGQTQPSAARRMGGGDRSLRVDAAQWPTPTNAMTTGAGTQGRDGGLNLQTSAERWATPTSHERTHTPRRVDHGEQLANQADRWAAPTSRDWKDGAEPSMEVATNSLLGRQALRAMHGPTFLNATGPRRLNPLFVQWLMGWPELTCFASMETESSHSRQQPRSESSGRH